MAILLASGQGWKTGAAAFLPAPSSRNSSGKNLGCLVGRASVGRHGLPHRDVLRHPVSPGIPLGRSATVRVSAATRDTTPRSPSSEEGAWWTIHNERYDLGSYLEEHPGGKTALFAARGRNCTELFESYHALAGDAPRKALARFHVGSASLGDPDYDDRFQWESTEFYDTLRARAREYFAGRSHKAPLTKLLFLAGCTLATGYVYATMFLQGNWWSLLLMPVLHWLGPCCLLHDGSHQSLVKSATLNHALSSLGNFFMSPVAWRHQHVLGHHVLTNVAGGDPDLEHFNGSQRGEVAFYGFRHHEDTVWRKPYRNWASWLAIMSPLTMVYPSVFEATDMVVHGSFMDLVPMQELSRAEKAMFWAGRLLVVGAIFVAPFFCGFTLPKAAAFAMAPYSVAGVVYYIFSQVSHINASLPANASLLTRGGDEAEPEGVEASKCPFTSLLALGGKPEWAVHQVQTTNDWGRGGVVANRASIGLDSQVVHHLFPSVCPSHYGALRDLVRETCESFGVEYVEHPSLGAALRGHLAVIADLNAAAAGGGGGTES